MSTPHSLFGTLQSFDLGNGKSGKFYSLPALEAAGVAEIVVARVEAGEIRGGAIFAVQDHCAADNAAGRTAHRHPFGSLNGLQM